MAARYARTTQNRKSSATVGQRGPGAGGGKTRGVFADRPTRSVKISGNARNAAKTTVQTPRGK